MKKQKAKDLLNLLNCPICNNQELILIEHDKKYWLILKRKGMKLSSPGHYIIMFKANSSFLHNDKEKRIEIGLKIIYK